MKNEEVIQTIEIGLKEKVLQFYFLNRNKVYIWVAGIVVAAVLSIVYLTSGPGPKELVLAKMALEQWKKDPSDQKLTKQMNSALSKMPGFEKSVQAEVAQILLANSQMDRAAAIAGDCIERLKEDSPLHAAFAEASLLIENKEYQKALELSVGIKERMETTMQIDRIREKAIEIGSALYAWNLLRIAFLQKELHNQPGELSAWEDVKALTQIEGASAGKFFEVNFGQSNFSLANFISQRERSIAL